MNGGPSVIVNKGGFFAALVKGVFGTIMVVVICATALGLYAMHAATTPAGAILKEIASNLPQWQKAMPAAIAEALDDRRALDYESQLNISTRTVLSGEDRDRGVVILEVKNNGKDVVSFLTLRVTVEDESDDRVLTLPITGASPIQIEDGWPGPLLPGHKKVISRGIRAVVGEPKVSYELTDLRVSNSGSAKAEPRELPSATANPVAARAARTEDSE